MLHRCFPWDAAAVEDHEGGALWIARAHQGEGRHDAPEHYGCLYLSDRPVSAVVEQLARFRGRPLRASMLVRRRLPLALATLEFDDAAGPLVDLDDPSTLGRERLRPSVVATRTRAVTQRWSLELWTRRPDAPGLAWWSTFEALWTNVTLFDRAVGRLRVVDLQPLTLTDPAVDAAREFLGLAPPR